jgi:hypothetical protein
MEAQEMAVAVLISATTVLRWTHAKVTIVKCLTGDDQKYNEANLMLTKHCVVERHAFLD